MHFRTKLLGSLLIAAVLVMGQTACDSKQVNENQSAAAFESDVNTKLKDYEARLADVKSQMSGRAEAVRNKVEVHTEQAEEKIETLRDSALPKLKEARGQEERDRIKDTVNDTLSEIDDTIAEAEDAIADAKTARERFSEGTNEKLQELTDRYEELKRQADDHGESAKAELDLALESAEEAIQEARSSLGTYKEAAEDQAKEIRDSIASLLSDASRELDKASEAMKNNEPG